MQYTEIMVRYGELSTKHKNRSDFIRQLGKNVQHALHSFKNVDVSAQWDRLHVRLNGDDPVKVMDHLKGVFGIENFSPVVRVDNHKNLDKAKKVAVAMVKKLYHGDGTTFKISTKRQDKKFPLDTYGVNDALGSTVIKHFPKIKAKMKNPDIVVRCEVRTNGIFLMTETIPGAGGLPVGTGGRATLMLSGGIDSPVATYLAMKRGVRVDMVHFYSPPYTSKQALNKAKELTANLAKYCGHINFIQVPFTKIQEEIKEKVPEGYLMTIQRRMMYRLAAAVTIQRHESGIFNGESLGQVASQTLESMVAINDVTTLPVLRPLLSMDKNQIIAIAKKLGTYKLSILPYEDCCTIFTPPSPKTKPNLEKSREYEKLIDVKGLTKQALANAKVTEIHPDDEFLDSQKKIFSQLL
ncbi:tRNA uracil 4-sulfurtransferase ThiI [Acetilactobacillus jinshanensis]|uniref:Probable tRNA sulfurtransferase n=1 Tax=Acetilactobacillus jinshanensis TaxID=1720083 RepID=A0A4P6ZMB4_9LACO|nr:tRNA uracil 4-sulfurtransferase ThiI [Acetilactobacillus jinshanensis]QBP18753.1 tRNA 4-thiouridine(8) synthase ThiI [Acetilactobacillus jinshanensis]URL61625.1 tRNA 4-thiouridine(8) synthase ThiI [uncultured bacterium]